MFLDIIGFVFVILFFAVLFVILISGPGSFLWLFQMRKRLDDMAEQNAKLEATLRRLQHDVNANKSSAPKPDVITLKSEESPFKTETPVQPAQPVQPAPPVAHFAPSTPVAQPPAPSVAPLTPPTPAERTAAQWAKTVPWVQTAPTEKPPQPKTDTPTKSDAQSASANKFVPKKITPKSIEQSDKEAVNKLELFIGQKLFGWIAVLGFIVAGALLIKVAIDYGLITDWIKVGGIAAFGAALLGAGYYSRRTGLRRFSTMLSSAGIILIYQAAYASFAFFHLIDATTAGVLMPVVVAGGFLLAWFYRSRLLGTVAILGGLAVPMLVSTGTDRHIELFIYLMSLNIGTLILVNLLRRAPIAWIAFFGTQALFWMWYNKFYQLDNLAAVLFFQSAFYIVFLADTVIAAVKPIGKRLIPTWDDAMRAIVTPIIFFGSITIFSEWGWNKENMNNIFLYDYLGTFAFIGAAWYATLALFYSRILVTREPAAVSPDGTVLEAATQSPALKYWQAAPSAATVIALGFVAIGIPLQFAATWITLGWLTVFAGLWFFGHRQTNRTFVVMACIFFGLGAIRLAGEIIEQLGGVREQLEMFALFNPIALPMLASATMLIVAAVLTGRFATSEPQPASSEPQPEGCVKTRPSGRGSDGCGSNWIKEARGINYFFGILGYLLLGIISSGEGARFLYANPSIWEPYGVQYLLSALLLGFWFALAVILLELGTVFRNAVVSIAATLALAFITILMVFIGFQMRVQYDVAFDNPFSVILIAGSVILLLLGLQSSFFNVCKSSQSPGRKHRNNTENTGAAAPGSVSDSVSSLQEKNILGSFSIAGLFMLLAILTIEWFNYLAPDLGKIATFRSVTVFWAFCALFLLAPRFSADSLPLRICGMIVLFAALLKTTFIDSTVSFGYCSWEWGAEYSLEDWIPLFNPYFMTMLIPVSLAIGFAVWTNRRKPSFVHKNESTAWLAAGTIGIVTLFIYLSIECYQYFALKDTLSEHYWRSFVGANALTIQWTFFAAILTLLAFIFHSKPLRILAMCLLMLAVFNVLLGVDFRPDALRLPFLNLYAIPMTLVSAALIGFGGLWLYRLGEEDAVERSVYRVIMFTGVVFLWFTMSIECFRSVRALTGPGERAQMALTSFWTGLAVILTLFAIHFKSKVLRIIAMLLLCLTVFKVLGIDMLVRPEYGMPFFNPYAMPILLLSMVVLALGCIWASRLGDDDAAEREFYRYVAFAGVAFLWFTMSVECFRSVRLLAGAADEAWRAQMALSILWSLFAGVLIAIGFIWRSSILRWMAILLFGTTLMKILIVDMSGANALYRLGAVFVLASLMMLAAWAYQRFKPEG